MPLLPECGQQPRLLSLAKPPGSLPQASPYSAALPSNGFPRAGNALHPATPPFMATCCLLCRAGCLPSQHPPSEWRSGPLGRFLQQSLLHALAPSERPHKTGEPQSPTWHLQKTSSKLFCCCIKMSNRRG